MLVKGIKKMALFINKTQQIEPFSIEGSKTKGDEQN
jgi:hypothetical protein